MHLGEIFFRLAKRTFVPTEVPSCETPAAVPDSLYAPSIGGPVLHFAFCFLAFVIVQEVFANEALFSSFGSFRSSAARAARSRSATCFCSSPIKDRLERYLAWYAHFVKGDATPARPEPAPKSRE
jgi:hypothetical protein